LGKSAATSLGAADIALKQNALMVPCYGQRKLDDGFSFDLIFEEPIPHGDPATMTQALNDSLSACIAQRPEQWFWVHRRWKPKRMARRSAKRARRETPPVS
jgi:KDO2-lipid IV(A) lauroyltransferase